jgi:hypothetical protein
VAAPWYRLLCLYRRVLVAGAGMVLLVAGFAWTLAEATFASPRDSRQSAAELAGRLALTDLVLVTEARYLRHLSLADRHSAFQDHPFALEHFPSGAVIGVPRHLRGSDAAPGADADTASPSAPVR